MSKVNTEQFGPITQIMCCRQRSSDHLISLREKKLCIIWYNIEKGTTSPRVACFYQNDCFWIMSQESQPNFNIQIWTMFPAQNVDQSLNTKSWQNFSFKILTTIRLQNFIQPQNVDQKSASKCWPNFCFKISSFNFKILTKPHPWYILNSLQRQISTKLLSTLFIKISYSNNINEFWVGIFTC